MIRASVMGSPCASPRLLIAANYLWLAAFTLAQVGAAGASDVDWAPPVVEAAERAGEGPEDGRPRCSPRRHNSTIWGCCSRRWCGFIIPTGAQMFTRNSSA